MESALPKRYSYHDGYYDEARCSMMDIRIILIIILNDTSALDSLRLDFYGSREKLNIRFDMSERATTIDKAAMARYLADYLTAQSAVGEIALIKSPCSPESRVKISRVTEITIASHARGGG